MGNGDGTFGAHVDYPSGAGPYAVTSGDFDGDGSPDLKIADRQDCHFSAGRRPTTLPAT